MFKSVSNEAYRCLDFGKTTGWVTDLIRSKEGKDTKMLILNKTNDSPQGKEMRLFNICFSCIFLPSL